MMYQILLCIHGGYFKDILHFPLHADDQATTPQRELISPIPQINTINYLTHTSFISTVPTWWILKVENNFTNRDSLGIVSTVLHPAGNLTIGNIVPKGG